jgi:ATP-dependent Clp protease ATP-binding subunit ClpA
VPKINVYVPDELAEAVRDAGVPVSAICQHALRQAVQRVTALREIATTMSLTTPLADPPVINFTRRAMTVLQLAQGSAGADGLSEAGTGHLLRALLAQGGMAVEVLTALDITPGQVRTALAAAETPFRADGGAASAGTGDGGGGGTGDSGATAGGSPRVVMSAHATLAIELAGNESSGLGNRYLGSEHLLLGLIGEPDGIAGSVLRSLGADLRVTRRTVAAVLAGWGAGLREHEQRACAEAAAERASTESVLAAADLSAAIRAELQPLVTRIDQLERRIPAHR